MILVLLQENESYVQVVKQEVHILILKKIIKFNMYLN